MPQFMLFLGGDTHRETLFQVEPSTEEGRYDQVGDGERLIFSPRHKGFDLGFFDWKISIHGRYGAGILLTEEQATALREKNVAVRAERQAAEPIAPSFDPERCMECGNKLNRRGGCSHCGGM